MRAKAEETDPTPEHPVLNVDFSNRREQIAKNSAKDCQFG